MPMCAEQYLERIKKIDALIENKREDYDRWFAIAEGMGGFSASEGVQSSKNLQKMPDAVGRYIVIDQEIKELERERESIIKTLERLPAIEYDLLFKFYAGTYSIKELARHFDKSIGWVKWKKRTALDLLQDFLNEKE
jgi:DNA-directed RNA polymerase specialized sigma24 family protein